MILAFSSLVVEWEGRVVKSQRGINFQGATWVWGVGQKLGVMMDA